MNWNEELEALSRHVRRRRLGADDCCALFADSCGLVVRTGVHDGALTTDEAEKVIDRLRDRMRKAAELSD